MIEASQKTIKPEPKKTIPQFTKHHRGDVRNAFEQELNADLVQIIPAVGWRAVYRYGDGELEIRPLVCWAIYDNPDVIGRNIQAFVIEDGEVTMVDTGGGDLDYLGILGPEQRLPKSWKRQARDKRKRPKLQGRLRSMADRMFSSLCQWA